MGGTPSPIRTFSTAVIIVRQRLAKFDKSIRDESIRRHGEGAEVYDLLRISDSVVDNGEREEREKEVLGDGGELWEPVNFL